MLLENVTDQTVRLAQMQVTVFLRHDAGGILTSMLEVCERVIERLIDGPLTDDSDDSAHSTLDQILFLKITAAKSRVVTNPLGDAIAVRSQLRLLPPGIFIEAGELQHDHT